MAKKHVVGLKPSERAILSAAATIFSGYAASGQVTTETEKEWLGKSLMQAIQLAKLTDESVQADGEFD
ncbi:MAG: hypothetical protein AB8G99_23400 [Planctomycetaceae bacterium]